MSHPEIFSEIIPESTSGNLSMKHSGQIIRNNEVFRKGLIRKNYSGKTCKNEAFGKMNPETEKLIRKM
jgi:hypothetical protein